LIKYLLTVQVDQNINFPVYFLLLFLQQFKSLLLFHQFFFQIFVGTKLFRCDNHLLQGILEVLLDDVLVDSHPTFLASITGNLHRRIWSNVQFFSALAFQYS